MLMSFVCSSCSLKKFEHIIYNNYFLPPSRGQNPTYCTFKSSKESKFQVSADMLVNLTVVMLGGTHRLHVWTRLHIKTRLQSCIVYQDFLLWSQPVSALWLLLFASRATSVAMITRWFTRLHSPFYSCNRPCWCLYDHLHAHTHTRKHTKTHTAALL